jgi:hypothetical protein
MRCFFTVLRPLWPLKNVDLFPFGWPDQVRTVLQVGQTGKTAFMSDRSGWVSEGSDPLAARVLQWRGI